VSNHHKFLTGRGWMGPKCWHPTLSPRSKAALLHTWTLLLMHACWRK